MGEDSVEADLTPCYEISDETITSTTIFNEAASVMTHSQSLQPKIRNVRSARFLGHGPTDRIMLRKEGRENFRIITAGRALESFIAWGKVCLGWRNSVASTFLKGSMETSILHSWKTYRISHLP